MNGRHRPPSGPGRDRSRGKQRRRPNHRSVTVDENRMASPPPGPAPGSPRTSGKVPARTPRWWPAASPLPACGTTGEHRGVRVTSRRNASSTGAPPGGGRCSRLPADRGDGAGTGRSGGAGREANSSRHRAMTAATAGPQHTLGRTTGRRGAHHRARAEIRPRRRTTQCRADGRPPTRGRVADLSSRRHGRSSPPTVAAYRW